MIHFLIPFLIFLLPFSGSSRSFFEIKATKDGEIPLVLDPFGFFFSVDLIKQSPEDFNVPSRGIMYPSLSSSNTMLALDQCLAFNKYDCSQYDCTEYPDQKADFVYPYFEAEGYNAKATLILDYDNWILNVPTALMSICTGWNMFGGNAYGIIGLGHADTSPNFIGSKIFSIYLPQDGSYGKLLFHWNSSYASSENPLVSLKSDDDWHVHSVNSILIGNSSLEVEDLELVFDLTGLGLGLPRAIFEDVLKNLKESHKIDCQGFYFNPNCTFVGYVKDFPSLAFKFATGETFVIPPEAYVKDGHDEVVRDPNITLSLRALSSEFEKNLSYVSPTYDKTIIVGSYIMRSFYLKFNIINNTISVYDANHSSLNTNDNFWNYVIILLILVAATLAICFIVGTKKTKRNESADKTAPLVNNTQ